MQNLPTIFQTYNTLPCSFLPIPNTKMIKCNPYIYLMAETWALDKNQITHI